MPKVANHLSYRILDVSSVKELARRWHPQEFKMAPQKLSIHRAHFDIKESIEELRFYKKNIFKPFR